MRFQRSTSQKTDPSAFNKGLKYGFIGAAAATALGAVGGTLLQLFNSSSLDIVTTTLMTTSFLSGLYGIAADQSASRETLPTSVRDRDRGASYVSLPIAGASIVALAAIHAPKFLQVFQP